MPPNFITKIDINYLLFDILNIIICKDIVMKSKKISYQPQSDQDVFDNLFQNIDLLFESHQDYLISATVSAKFL